MSADFSGAGDVLFDNIATLRGRAEQLQQRLVEDGSDPEARLREAVAELYISLEELEVASEEQRQSAEQLREAHANGERERARYRDLFVNAPDGYVVTNDTGIVQESNHAAAVMLGVDEQYLSGKPLSVYVDPKDQRQFRTLLGSLRDGNPQGEQVLGIVPRNGEPFQAAFTVHTDLGPRGGLTGTRWQIRDVTSRARLLEERVRGDREELAHQSAELGRLLVIETLERMTDAFLSVDRDWHVTYHNNGAEALFRRLSRNAEAAFEDEHLRDILGAYCFERCERIWGSGSADSFEVEYPDVGLWLNVRVFPGEDGTTIYFRDITQRKEGEELVRQLSTPVVEIAERVLLLPLVGRVDAQRAQDMTHTVLRAVRESRARVLVIDITGAMFAEHQDANALMQMAQAIKLLGATTIVTGISVQTSLALTQNRVRMDGAVTTGDLRSGIERALRIAEGVAV